MEKELLPTSSFQNEEPAVLTFAAHDPGANKLDVIGIFVTFQLVVSKGVLFQRALQYLDGRLEMQSVHFTARQASTRSRN